MAREVGVVGLPLAVARDLRDWRPGLDPEQLLDFETDVMAGFVLARASAGLADSTIRHDVSNLEHVRGWFERPLWEMQPPDADRYFGEVMRTAARGTRHARAQTLTTYFEFLELRHKAELHELTGRIVECPIDEMNRPRGQKDAALRIPPTATELGELFAGWRGELATCRKFAPTATELGELFAGWRGELATCRKFAPTARNYTAAKLSSLVGLRINETRSLDLDDVKWHLGPFGKLHVRVGKGSRGSGPRERMVPLINGADRLLRWFVEDVWGHFGDDHARPGAPLFPSERHAGDGSATRVGCNALRVGLVTATSVYLPSWAGRLTPHVLRHFCASELYLSGADLLSIQEILGHAWVATTMKYVHIHRTRIEEALLAGQQRAARRLEGLLP